MSRPRHYILIGRKPVPVADFLEWALWFGTADRTVAFDRIGQWEVSTVFLGVDHSFSRTGPPLIFETMVFDLDGDQSYQTRCSTWAEALGMHLMALAQIRVGVCV